ncbi:MAG TPA: oxidoreductase [Prolixibacteraceae bacterium]|jgi:NAD(P)-dependent dehydrogenase (short-subunit alcohol dehydrogenase family)|nr:oxidoreductase [Prolixibacteraceae bacterium]
MAKNWTFENIPDLQGKTIIVTGGNSGLGYESVKAFALKGATVVLACRNLAKGEKAKNEILKANPSGEIKVMQLDLASLASVEAFAKKFANEHKQLHVLLNNAGIMATPNVKTVDGFEAQLGTNYLGHYALTGHLLPLLKATSKSRVVNVSSLAHKGGKIDFNDLMFEKGRKFKPMRAYAQSKLANLLFAYQLQRFFEANTIDCIAVAAHPGGSNTRLAGHLETNRFVEAISKIARGAMQPAAKGALPQICASVDPNVKGGDYFGPHGLGELFGYPVLVKSNAASHNEKNARKLWEVSEKLTGVKYA